MTLNELKIRGRVVWSRWYKPPSRMIAIEPFVCRGMRYVAARATKSGPRYYAVNNCSWCGGAFLSSRWDALYCSDRCRKERNRKNA